MEPSTPIIVKSRTVGCGGGAGGHPKVYLNVGESGGVVCPYCSQHYVLSEGARGAVGR